MKGFLELVGVRGGLGVGKEYVGGWVGVGIDVVYGVEGRLEEIERGKVRENVELRVEICGVGERVLVV